MAPLKTMAHGQQEQASHRQNQGGDQTTKPRKRKGNKQQSNNTNNKNNNNPSAQPNEAVQSSKSLKQQVSSGNLKSIEGNITSETSSAKQELPQSPKTVKKVVAAERTLIKINNDSFVPTKPVKEVIVPNQLTALPVKQLSAEEPDDVDAGIELDGSSNSGSSVKDINEDQSKSASVSPVMAQSNLENSSNTTTKHAVEVSPVEQIAGSLCSDIGPASKKASTTKQQLAANQEVIDADEQHLQQKLRTRQRKSSLKGSLNTSAASVSASASNNSVSSNNVVATPQSPALCKICDQDVYQMERVMAEKAIYHRSCFRCFQCKVQLRVDNYSSHEGHVYCKAHHRQLFQPQVKLDSEDDVDIVAKSTSKVVDEYLLQRGRLSELSFSFLKPKPEEIRKRQMIICENEPAELPKDVVRSNTKVDDGIDRLNINLNNIMERFERGKTSDGEDSQASSAGIVIEKPSFDIKKTLMAFETNAIKSNDDDTNEEDKQKQRPGRRVVKKLSNLNEIFNRQNSSESESSQNSASAKPLAMRRSESLMMRLKKYESRINGEQVADEDPDDDEADGSELKPNESGENNSVKTKRIVPKKLTSLKNQWENGDISKRRFNHNNDEADADDEANASNGNNQSDSINGNSPLAEKNEELFRIRQQLARKKSDESASIKNIYENAIREAQEQQQKRSPKLNSSDLSALNGFSTTEIQQQLLQNGNNRNSSTPSTPNKDHFQLNLSNKANKLKEKFELGLIKNNSMDDSDASQGDDEPTMSRMEQLRQEKLEDLSIFAEGEIKAREARSMFQQIDRRLSAANSNAGSRNSLTSSSRSPASISASMSSRLQSKIQATADMNDTSSSNNSDSKTDENARQNERQIQQQQPIRLTNNVRT